jgi:hypothetical protein
LRLNLTLVAAGLLLAGCFGDSPSAAPAPFDGQAAYDWTEGLVTHSNGTPRFRVPGTASHVEAGQWLYEAMNVDGWQRSRQPFTGADYVPLNKGQTSVYYDNSAFCTEAERRHVASNVSFENYWAIRDNPSSGRLVLLGAHWDSKKSTFEDPNQPVLGANDGAAGVGLLLQFMRHVMEHQVRFAFDVGVIFFDGEDGFDDCHPLAGSIYYVSQLSPDDVDRLILLDMIGDPNARFIRERHSTGCDPSLVDLIWSLAPAHGLGPNFASSSSYMFDDHLPFIEANIPAIDIIDYGRGFPSYWHTAHDTMDNISPDMLGRMGNLLLAVLQDARFTATWPTSCSPSP